MILSNFLSWLINNASWTSMAGTSISQTNGGGAVTANANNVNCYYTTTLSGSYVDVGFGNTAETASDYKLANSNAMDTPTLTFVSNGFVASGTYPYVRNLTTTYANNTGNDVTITEVGYVQKSGNTSSGSNPAFDVLLTRTVLDTPITVAAGSTVAITVTLEV